MALFNNQRLRMVLKQILQLYSIQLQSQRTKYLHHLLVRLQRVLIYQTTQLIILQVMEQQQVLL